MDKRIESKNPIVGAEDRELNNEINILLAKLPKATNWDGRELCQYQGFWLMSEFLHGTISFQRLFKAQDRDIILITLPKSGTTWLKALTFTIVNRSRHALENSPLLTNSPHDLFPFFELNVYNRSQSPNLEDLPTPRIFSTHTPSALLPNSIVTSNCRIVYLCRNPLDQFISHWKFLVGLRDQTTEPFSLDEAFAMACNGVQGYGPFWEHVLGYWKVSKEKPHKILFLKYEDLIEDINFYVKKLADFLGYPFSKEEESQGVIQEISKFCSFENLKNLEVNKTGKEFVKLDEGFFKPKNSMFFREGKVGDWRNYLSPSMAERLEKLIEEKLGDSGLTFKKS